MMWRPGCNCTVHQPTVLHRFFLATTIYNGYLYCVALNSGGPCLYGACHLVTATVDSGQINRRFFFCNTPVGRHRQISFDLEDVFTQFLHNFEVYITGNYYTLHFHWSKWREIFIVLVLFPGMGGCNNLRSIVHTVSHRLEPDLTEVEKIIYAIFGHYYVSWPNQVHTHL